MLPVKFLDKNEINILKALLLITILLRTVFTFINYSSTGTTGWSDDIYYLYVGEQIAEGNWEPHFDNRTQIIVGPTLPLLIALFKILFGNPIVPFFVYNILCTSIMVPVLYLLGKELLNKNVGWLLAIWGVFFAEAFKYSPHILKETTLFLFVPLTLLFLIRSINTEKPFQNLIFASLSFAWLIHTDERFFVYLPFFVLFFFFIKPLNLKTYTRYAASWILLGLLLMLPWTIRNYKVFDQLVILTPRTTAITANFWGENLEEAASHFTNDEVRKRMNEARYERAVEFGEKHGVVPREHGKIEARIKAFQHFWQPTYFKLHFIQYGFRTEKWSVRHNAVSLLFYGIFLPFYIIGMFLLYRRNLFLPLFIGTIPIIHSLMHAYMVWSLERYRSPITFIVVMIGVWATLELLKAIKVKNFTV